MNTFTAVLVAVVHLGAIVLSIDPVHAQSGNVEEAWVQHYSSGLAPSFDVAIDIAGDRSGNIYVTGYTDIPGTGSDYLTIKYDTQGHLVWVARYEGEGHGRDLPAAISVDDDGSIYVSGTSVGNGTSSDYTTIKYDTEGTQQWVARYNGPANSDDEVSAMAMDASGNIYVTGKSMGIGSSFDVATVKYNAAGERQWVARYQGPADSRDGAVALDVAHTGNVYVTGCSQAYAIGSSYFITIKYDASGAEQWAVRYEGIDRSAALALDEDENVYVTGSSKGPDMNADYATIKYDHSGITQWIARHSSQEVTGDRAQAIAVDSASNSYVTGNTATIKYDRAGVPQWTIDASSASAITLDHAGNVFVTGRDYRTIKYDHTGVALWQIQHTPANGRADAKALFVDSDGSVIVTGTSMLYGFGDSRLETVKLRSDGNEQWGAVHNSGGNSREEIKGLAFDGEGNVYVTGSSYSATSGLDWLTIKYHSSGEVAWIGRYNGSGNSADEPKGIASDQTGSVYVTGVSFNENSKAEYVTIKYDRMGAVRWHVRHNDPASQYEGANALVLDNAGNVYVTGRSTIKYDSSGVMQWVTPHSELGMASAIALDARGNLYFKSGHVFKLSPEGAIQWSQGLRLQVVTGFAVDDSGNAHATGWSEPGHGVSSYETFKYDSEGVLHWKAEYQQTYNADDKPSALALDRSGNVYVTGRSGSDITTIKYNPDGEEQWIARHGSGGGTAVVVDVAGNVHVTGQSRLFGSLEYDFVTIKYNSEGSEQWVASFDGPQASSDQPLAIGLAGALANGIVCVAGNSSYGGRSIYTIVVYSQNAVGVEDRPRNLPAAYSLSQNYPNPFNPSTTIRYAIPKPAFVSLKIYDVTGREMTTVVQETKSAGEHEVRWHAGDLPDGLYLYRLQVGDPSAASQQYFSATKKLIMLR